MPRDKLDNEKVPLRDACKALGISERTFYRLQAEGRLPAGLFLPKLGKRWYASRSALDAYLRLK